MAVACCSGRAPRVLRPGPHPNAGGGRLMRRTRRRTTMSTTLGAGRQTAAAVLVRLDRLPAATLAEKQKRRWHSVGAAICIGLRSRQSRRL